MLVPASEPSVTTTLRGALRPKPGPAGSAGNARPRRGGGRGAGAGPCRDRVARGPDLGAVDVGADDRDDGDHEQPERDQEAEADDGEGELAHDSGVSAPRCGR